MIWNNGADVKFGLVNCLPSRDALRAYFFFCSDSIQLTVFIELVAVSSLDTFNLSMGPTAVPMIRVPRVRTDLETLSSKWVQGLRQYKFASVHRNNGL